MIWFAVGLLCVVSYCMLCSFVHAMSRMLLDLSTLLLSSQHRTSELYLQTLKLPSFWNSDKLDRKSSSVTRNNVKEWLSRAFGAFFSISSISMEPNLTFKVELFKFDESTVTTTLSKRTPTDGPEPHRHLRPPTHDPGSLEQANTLSQSPKQ